MKVLPKSVSRHSMLVYGMLCLGLFIFCMYRAVKLDFTNDEAFSYLNVDTLNFHMMYGTANTHWLNTACMMLLNFLAGDQEWILRIHAVIAVLFFSFFLIRIFSSITSFWLTLIPITLILLNPYWIDYFSLARGYALSLTFECMAFYYLLFPNSRGLFRMYLCLSLAVLSNYTSLYLLFAFLILDLLTLIREKNFRAVFSLSFYTTRWPALLMSAWAIPNLLFIKYITNDLREGKKNGFIQDSLATFFHRSFPFLSATFCYWFCLITCTGILCGFIFWSNKMLPGFRKLILVFGICILMSAFFFVVLHIPFPFGRTSFSLVFLFLVILSYLLVLVLRALPSQAITLFSILFCLLNGFLLLHNRNWNSTIEYWQQQGIKQCFNDLYTHEGTHIHQIKIGMSIDHFGSFLNYYKHRNPSMYPDSVFVYSREGYEKMETAERNQFAQQDYLLMIGDYHAFLKTVLPDENTDTIGCYPDMKSCLLKVKKP